ncbi:hypothetical protein ACFQFG_02125 [Methylobacterium persicinum]
MMRVVGRLLLGAFALLLAVAAAALTVALLFDPGANAWLARGALAGLDALGDVAAGLPPKAFCSSSPGSPGRCSSSSSSRPP